MYSPPDNDAEPLLRSRLHSEKDLDDYGIRNRPHWSACNIRRFFWLGSTFLIVALGSWMVLGIASAQLDPVVGDVSRRVPIAHSVDAPLPTAPAILRPPLLAEEEIQLPTPALILDDNVEPPPFEGAATPTPAEVSPPRITKHVALRPAASAMASAGSQGLTNKYSASIHHIDHTLRQNLSHLAEAAMQLHGAILTADAPRIDFNGATSIEELDQLACGRSPCRFISVRSVIEQNTKAELHITQLALLAKRLDRALVLPNVRGGRFGSCHDNPFDLYHDRAEVSDMFDVPTMLWTDLERYSQLRATLGARLTLQPVSVLRLVTKSRDPLVEYPSAKADQCLGRGDFDIESFQASVLKTGRKSIMHLSAIRTAFGQWLGDTLNSDSYAAKSAVKGARGRPDVLHINWGIDVRIYDRDRVEAKLETQAGPILPFHPRWRAVADAIAGALSPAVALHWRQETLADILGRTPDFVKCAKGAEQRLLGLGPDLKTVYFMTDYPLDATVHSDSYVKTLEVQSDLAKAAKAGIDELLQWSVFDTAAGQEHSLSMITLDSLDLDTAMSNGQRVLLRDLDPGLLGVIDKLVAERMEWYLVGTPRRCARLSNYSVQLVRERRRRMQEGDAIIRQDVAYFPSDPRHGYRM